VCGALQAIGPLRVACDGRAMERDGHGDEGVHPQAPTEAEWARLSAAERAAVVDALPAAMTDAETSPPEGDLHDDARNDARATLREALVREQRRVD
jgi:hypothetical protein